MKSKFFNKVNISLFKNLWINVILYQSIGGFVETLHYLDLNFLINYLLHLLILVVIEMKEDLLQFEPFLFKGILSNQFFQSYS